ncbi:hypothetical protein ACJX0J_039386, partial [Zea mays]
MLNKNPFLGYQEHIGPINLNKQYTTQYLPYSHCLQLSQIGPYGHLHIIYKPRAILQLSIKAGEKDKNMQPDLHRKLKCVTSYSTSLASQARSQGSIDMLYLIVNLLLYDQNKIIVCLYI